MKFLLSGLFISLAVSLSAAKPACYWDFDNINPKTRAPLSNNGIHYYNALIIENGGVNGTNGLLCNGKRRNQIVLPLDCKEWTAELKFKLDRADSADSRYLFAYEHAAWNLARFLLYIDRNGRLTGDFHRLKMPEKTVEKQFIFSSEKRSWQLGKWYTVRIASKSGGPARIWLDGEMVAGKDNALALSDLNDGRNHKWYPQVSLGCNPRNPSKVGSPLFGVVDDLKIWKNYEEPEKPSVSSVISGNNEAQNYVMITEKEKEWSTPFRILDRETGPAGNFHKAEDKFVKNASRAAIRHENGILYVYFQCPVPKDMKITTGTGDSLWKECVEFFIRPDIKSPVYYQYAAGANGKFEAMRYFATGSQDKTFRSKASCNVSNGDSCYWVEMRIPASEVGLDKFKPGMTAAGNFTRTGASCGGLSTWSPIGTSFHNPERFGRLIFGSRQAYISNCLAKMKKELASLNAAGASITTLEKRLAEAEKLNGTSGGTPSGFAKLENQLEYLRKSMVAARLSSSSSLIWKPDVWGNDIEISMVSRPLEKINLTSARNSRILYGFAVSNLTDKPFLGQIKLFPGDYPTKTSENSFSNDSAFHELFNRVKMREGLPQTTSSETFLYDAMVPLPLNTLLRIPPKSTVPLWMELSTADLPAGNYTGTLVLKPAYRGFAVGKVPFMLEILPVDLGKIFVRNFNYTYLERSYTFHDELRKKWSVSPLTRFLAEHGINVASINIDASPKVNADGSIKSVDFTGLDRQLDDLITLGVPADELSVCFYLGWEHSWARLYYREPSIKEPGKSRKAGKIFPPSCSFGTPEWDKAAKMFVKELASHVMRKYKLSPERIIFYPVDEPHGKIEDPNSKNHLAFKFGKLIKEALPECRIMVNPFSYKLDQEYLEVLKRYCDLFDIIELYRPKLATPETIRIVKEAKRELWTYNILQKETAPEVYRRLYWENFRDGVDDVAAFWHIDQMAGGDGFDPYDSNRYNRKNRTDYGTVYADFNFGKVLTSRRMEAHFQGLYDYKAAKLCRQMLKRKENPEAQKKLDEIVSRAIQGDCETMAACRVELLRLVESLQNK